MRVLTVGNMYPPHHQGGYELVWQGAVTHLRGVGHEVRVLTSDHRTGSESPEEADVHRQLRLYWVDHSFPRRSIADCRAIETHNLGALSRHLTEFEPDVLAWWAMGGLSLSLLEHVRRAGLATVAFVHDDWLVYGPRADAWQRRFGHPAMLARLIERATGIPTRLNLAAAARYVFVSQATRERARACGLDPPASAVVPSGIASSLHSAGPAPDRLWDWRLLYVGRLDERKGISTAIEALTQLPHGRLRVVGGGDPRELARLRAQAEQLGVADRVSFCGGVARDELPAVYEQADVVVFPVTWEEPWGLVPLEAMAQGRCVLATGRGGSGEYLLDGQNCLLFEAGDARALAQAVNRLASEPELRSRLRAGALQTAAGHTDERFHAAVEAVLEQAVTDAGPGPGR